MPFSMPRSNNTEEKYREKQKWDIAYPPFKAIKNHGIWLAENSSYQQLPSFYIITKFKSWS